jgi:CBS domain-containing protein
MKVKDIMTKNVIIVSPETPINKVAEELYKNGFTGVPVVEGNKLVGIITEADLVMQKAKIHFPQYVQILDSFLYLENPGKIELEMHKVLGAKAEEVMNPDVYTIDADASVEELVDLITTHHLNPVPVVKNDKLVGIVSRADLVKLLIKNNK